MAQKHDAIDAAQVINGGTTDITYRRSDGNRHEFDYSDGCIQAHRLPEDWEFTGFGPKWFAIRPR